MRVNQRRSVTSAPVAFSMVELLVVIGIIGILSALLLVGISSAKARVRRIQCANNVRQLGQALQLFVADSHVYPLLVNVGYWKEKYTEHFTSWEAVIENELSKNFPRTNWAEPKGARDCPSAERPSDWPEDRGYVEYGYNGYGLSEINETNTTGLGGHKVELPSFAPPVRESEIAVPSEMMAIGGGFKGGNGVFEDGSTILWRTSTAKEIVGSTKRSSSRHQGKANVVFCDGHVESPTLKLLFETKTDDALVHWNRDHLTHSDNLR